MKEGAPAVLAEHRREPVDTVVDIETPERIRFACRLAGPAQRALAYLVDVLLRGAVVAGFLLIFSVLGAFGSVLSGVGLGLILLAAFVLEWGYFVICEALMRGQSPGKRALGLRVVRGDGLPIGFGDSVLRNLLRAADFLPTFHALGALMMSLDPQFRRLGDLVAGTLVISERGEPVLPPIKISPEPTAAELARLPSRVPLSADELDAVEQFVRRSRELNPLRERELAEMVAPIFARRLALRYRDPVRFLALLYVRATSGAGE